MSLILRAVAASDRGLVRTNNEDSAFVDSRLLVVADGVGGAPAGEVASDIVVRTLAGAADEIAGAGPDQALRLLTEAAERANHEIALAVEAKPDTRGMGTTMTTVVLTGGSLALLHVGDSRAYLLHDSQLRQLTRDDTYVQALVDRGVLTPEEARRHPRKSLVTQAVQGQPLTPSSAVVPVAEGDRLLLCSDGLSDVVTDDVIAETLRSYPDLDGCAASLIKLALDGGGPDNITVVIADLVTVEP